VDSLSRGDAKPQLRLVRANVILQFDIKWRPSESFLKTPLEAGDVLILIGRR